MEIERKFWVPVLPVQYKQYPYDVIAQGYVSTSPVIRIRQKGIEYFLTCKSKGLMAREEFEIPLTEVEFLKLKEKIDHQMLSKERYYIPLTESLMLEMDVFKGHLEGLVVAEVEFPSLEAAHQFTPPTWLGRELTQDCRFQNNNLCQIAQVTDLLTSIQP